MQRTVVSPAVIQAPPKTMNIKCITTESRVFYKNLSTHHWSINIIEMYDKLHAHPITKIEAITLRNESIEILESLRRNFLVDENTQKYDHSENSTR